MSESYKKYCPQRFKKVLMTKGFRLVLLRKRTTRKCIDIRDYLSTNNETDEEYEESFIIKSLSYSLNTQKNIFSK